MERREEQGQEWEEFGPGGRWNGSVIGTKVWRHLGLREREKRPGGGVAGLRSFGHPRKDAAVIKQSLEGNKVDAQ